MSSPSNRASIQADGLQPHQPVEDGNYDLCYMLENQPRGVYVTPLYQDGWTYATDDDQPSYDDAWTFAYVGPIAPDQHMDGSAVIPGPIAPDALDLIPCADSYE